MAPPSADIKVRQTSGVGPGGTSIDVHSAYVRTGLTDHLAAVLTIVLLAVGLAVSGAEVYDLKPEPDAAAPLCKVGGRWCWHEVSRSRLPPCRGAETSLNPFNDPETGP
jgi:hypothetical protein